jgi:hypothetical protein
MSRRDTRVRWFVEFRGRGKGGTWQLWDVDPHGKEKARMLALDALKRFAGKLRFRLVPHRIGKPEEVKRAR